MAVCRLIFLLSMAQELVQHQSITQTQTLSPLQVALVRLLELPVSDLSERVQNEMLENSALEEADREEPATHDEETETGEDDHDTRDDETGTGDDDALGDYLNADDVPDYLVNRTEEQREQRDIMLTEDTSFYENLRRQVSEHDLSGQEKQLMEYLIGSLDADGYLRKDLDTLCDELAIYHNLTTSREELEKLLKILQSFEPRGIGARNLQECLRLQLTNPEQPLNYRREALEVVDRCFDDFIHKRKENIMRRLGMDEETYAHVLRELTHLNPLPGNALNEGNSPSAPTVVPDFYVTVNSEGEAEVSLNNGDIPELRISPSFRDSIKEFSANSKNLSREQKDTYIYMRQKVEAAQSFIDILHRRRQTLLAVMGTIVRLQRPFFDEDDESCLRPMTLKDIAERTNLDISTVSRVTNSKYVQTDYGTYPLKFFFSSQFVSKDGEDLSSRQIKAALRELIENEDKTKPLPDEALATMLKSKGFPVARRTVAKYREQIGFPPARLRR